MLGANYTYVEHYGQLTTVKRVKGGLCIAKKQQKQKNGGGAEEEEEDRRKSKERDHE